MIDLQKQKLNNSFGLKETDLEEIISVLSQQPEVKEAFIFGSRAKGNFKKGSDVDIALKGEKLNLQITSHISLLLNEETTMPYRFDLLNYHTISNKELTDHVNRLGVLFYKKNE